MMGLRATLRALEDAPTQSVAERAKSLAITEAEAENMVEAAEESVPTCALR